MSTSRSDKWKLFGAAVALAIAAIGFVRFYRNSSPAEGKAFFYDLSAKQLFTAPHGSAPPIMGVSGPEEDGVRAIVISVSGNCADEKSRIVAYLETYTPELKRQVEARKEAPAGAASPVPSIGRSEAQGFILVKRLEDSQWHPMTSPEAQKILEILSAPGPAGNLPAVCVP